jgi:hypothetical protein
MPTDQRVGALHHRSMMRIPFTVDQFFDVFRRYNEAVWPMQAVLYAMAFAAVGIAAFGSRRQGPARRGRLIGGILAVLWLWMAVVYHFTFFREINPAATIFGALFIVQSMVLVRSVWRDELDFRVGRNARGVVGGLIVAYGLIVYPLFGHALGHRYPSSPTFGLPCPTTIFTLGMLLWVRPPVPHVLLVVPVLWAVVGTVGALQLDVPEDLGLPVAGALVTILVLVRRRPAYGRVVRGSPSPTVAR